VVVGGDDERHPGWSSGGGVHRLIKHLTYERRNLRNPLALQGVTGRRGATRSRTAPREAARFQFDLKVFDLKMMERV
jgi:hypothetical protein